SVYPGPHDPTQARTKARARCEQGFRISIGARAGAAWRSGGGGVAPFLGIAPRRGTSAGAARGRSGGGGRRRNGRSRWPDRPRIRRRSPDAAPPTGRTSSTRWTVVHVVAREEEHAKTQRRKGRSVSGRGRSRPPRSLLVLSLRLARVRRVREVICAGAAVDPRAGPGPSPLRRGLLVPRGQLSSGCLRFVRPVFHVEHRPATGASAAAPPSRYPPPREEAPWAGCSIITRRSSSGGGTR